VSFRSWKFIRGGANRYRLQGEVLKRGVEIHRASVDDIRELFERFPNVKAVFNCTGLGSYSLKGVEDKLLYPTRVCIPNSSLRAMKLIRSRVKSCLWRTQKLQ